MSRESALWPMKVYFETCKSIKAHAYGLLTKLPGLIIICDFPTSSFKPKGGIIPLLTK